MSSSSYPHHFGHPDPYQIDSGSGSAYPHQIEIKTGSISRWYAGSGYDSASIFLLKLLAFCSVIFRCKWILSFKPKYPLSPDPPHFGNPDPYQINQDPYLHISINNQKPDPHQNDNLYPDANPHQFFFSIYQHSVLWYFDVNESSHFYRNIHFFWSASFWELGSVSNNQDPGSPISIK